jgi:hypothetical protein
MASRREERKDEAARQAEAQEVVSRTLDEAKDSTEGDGGGKEGHLYPHRVS